MQLLMSASVKIIISQLSALIFVRRDVQSASLFLGF